MPDIKNVDVNSPTKKKGGGELFNSSSPHFRKSQMLLNSVKITHQISFAKSPHTHTHKGMDTDSFQVLSEIIQRPRQIVRGNALESPKKR